MAVSFTNISVGSFWTRPDLAELWGYRAYQALARGVVTPAGADQIILFVTEEKQTSATSYKDILKEDILEWEGPNDHFAEGRMLRARETGEAIHLFHRQRHHSPFQYKGEIVVTDKKLKTNAPSKFIFEILDPHREAWTHDQLLAAFYLYLQLKPHEIQNSSPLVVQFAGQLGKSGDAVAAKLRTLAQLDPVLVTKSTRASDNVTDLDKQVSLEFQNNWTATTLTANEAFEDVVGAYEAAADAGQISAADASYLFRAGQTREALVEIRINQRIFRTAILNGYNSTCCISGLKNEKLLIASHIVPWSMDVENRLNPANGLCLSALHDRAYDQGLITVLPDLTIRVSAGLMQQRSNSFLTESLLRYDGKKIAIPGRYPPHSKFLESHATRFGYIGQPVISK